MQQGKYPILCGDNFQSFRHYIIMNSKAFDIVAVKAAMRARGITQADIKQYLGLTSQSAVSNILNGKRKVSADEAQMIYRLLDIRDGLDSQIRIIPIIGLTSAGAWREAVLSPSGEMALPSSVSGPNSFALEVSGDSMNLLIEDGGFVVVDPDQKVLQAGKCYLIQNGEHETTVKSFKKEPDRFCPMSSNADHKEILMSEIDFMVLGRVTWKGSPV